MKDTDFENDKIKMVLKLGGKITFLKNQIKLIQEAKTPTELSIVLLMGIKELEENDLE